jgi:hypothetical protein
LSLAVPRRKYFPHVGEKPGDEPGPLLFLRSGLVRGRDADRDEVGPQGDLLGAERVAGLAQLRDGGLVLQGLGADRLDPVHLAAGEQQVGAADRDGDDEQHAQRPGQAVRGAAGSGADIHLGLADVDPGRADLDVLGLHLGVPAGRYPRRVILRAGHARILTCHLMAPAR